MTTDASTPSQRSSTTGELTIDSVAPPPTPGVDDLSSGTLVGRYIIIGRLGAGAMGVVFTAYDPELDRKIALKLLHARGNATLDARARLLREAKSLARLAHPNVVGVHDVGTYGEHIFLAMEFVAGRTLTAWLKEQPRRWPEITEVLCCAGEGLAAAHAAGLVHRDFKPDNVLIGDDGRVRVLDFGLARSATDAPDSMSDSETRAALADASASASRSREHEHEQALVTRTGARIGTPAYMSPEQHLGRPADALSDQFSYCVALYQALYGVRPFTGSGLSALSYQILRGKIDPPPPGSRVPTWLRKIVVRGLAINSEQRHPSMPALLAALARDRRPGRPAHWLLAGFVGLGLGLGVWAAARGPTEAARCQGAALKLAGIWDAERIAAIERAFLASGVSYAQDTWHSTRAALTDYAERWQQAHHDACAATHILGEQSGRALDLRARCLDRRLGRLAAVSDSLLHPSPSAIEHAPEAISKLGDLAACSDVDALSAVVPPPDDPARVAAIEAKLAQTAALDLAGAFTRAFELSAVAVADAAALGYGPLEADALLVYARAQQRLARFEAAAESLHAAVRAAARGRDDQLVATAWLELVFHVGAYQPDEARLDADGLAADAALIRAGDDLLLRARLDQGMAAGLHHFGRQDNALVRIQRALAVLEREPEREPAQLLQALHIQAMLQDKQGARAEAERSYERAIAASERVFGRRHPDTASLLNSVAELALDRGDLDRAEALALEAYEVRQRTLPRGHPSRAHSAQTLAHIAERRGDLDVTEARYAEALAIFRGQPEPDSMHLAALHNDLAMLGDKQGHLARARGHYREALALFRKLFGPDNSYPRTVERNLAEVSIWLDEPQLALTILDPLIATAPLEPPIDPPLPYLFCLRAQALRALGRHADARLIAERAVHDLDAHLGGALEDDEAAIVRATLARLLPRVGVDGKRRAALLLLAEPALEAAVATSTAAARALAALREEPPR